MTDARGARTSAIASRNEDGTVVSISDRTNEIMSSSSCSFMIPSHLSTFRTSLSTFHALVSVLAQQHSRLYLPQSRVEVARLAILPHAQRLARRSDADRLSWGYPAA